MATTGTPTNAGILSTITRQPEIVRTWQFVTQAVDSDSRVLEQLSVDCVKQLIRMSEKKVAPTIEDPFYLNLDDTSSTYNPELSGKAATQKAPMKHRQIASLEVAFSSVGGSMATSDGSDLAIGGNIELRVHLEPSPKDVVGPKQYGQLKVMILNTSEKAKNAIAICVSGIMRDEDNNTVNLYGSSHAGYNIQNESVMVPNESFINFEAHGITQALLDGAQTTAGLKGEQYKSLIPGKSNQSVAYTPGEIARKKAADEKKEAKTQWLADKNSKNKSAFKGPAKKD